MRTNPLEGTLNLHQDIKLIFRNLGWLSGFIKGGFQSF